MKPTDPTPAEIAAACVAGWEAGKAGKLFNGSPKTNEFFSPVFKRPFPLQIVSWSDFQNKRLGIA